MFSLGLVHKHKRVIITGLMHVEVMHSEECIFVITTKEGIQ